MVTRAALVVTRSASMMTRSASMVTGSGLWLYLFILDSFLFVW
jgi:hypothetical protein